MARFEAMTWGKWSIDFSDGCVVMGILNVTPDSFSDGGRFNDIDRAVAHGIEMAGAGAAIIDVGAESTRPGSEAVPVDEQIRRAVPVIEKLSQTVDVPVSIDTMDYKVAKAAVEAGAAILNDISALSDERMAGLAAEHDLPVVLMHKQGTPGTMQNNPVYRDVVCDVCEYLAGRAEYAMSMGIKRQRIMLDPGIGFGKTFEHNIQLMKQLDVLCELGYPVLVGASRKRFIGTITGKDVPAERIFGTAATVAHSVLKGAAVVRVHDVPQMLDVVKVANQLREE